MPKHIGILCAMPQEIGTALNYLRNTIVNHYGDLKIYSGDLFLNNESTNSIYLSIAWSGWGKVSSARAATRMIALAEKNNSPLDLLIFTGVAGAVKENLKQWLTQGKMLSDTIDILDAKIINIGINFTLISNLEANKFDVLSDAIAELEVFYNRKFEQSS